MAGAFCGALALAAAMLAARGLDEHGIDGALFATGRLAFVFFWPAYAGSATASLLGAPFEPLRRHARVAGLAFASVLVVHLGLIAALCLIGAPPSLHTFVFFGIAAGFAFLLTLFSVPRLHRAMPGPLWWVLRTVGMNYIAYAFAVDFLNRPLQGGPVRVALYLPFAVLAVLGPSLRLAAFARRLAAARAPRHPGRPLARE